MRTRAALSGIAYAKLLRLPLTGPDSVGAGILTNMLTTDADALLPFWEGFLGLVLQPLEIAGIVALLFYFVGWAALGGVAVLAVAMAITQAASNWADRVAVGRDTYTDRRCVAANELVSGIKACTALHCMRGPGSAHMDS
jgi:ABC-type multidrug transport system fused ATPase/permease subunit